MIFKDATQVQTVVQEIWRAECIRARNRARINKLFNGEAPYTPQEVTENKIGINVNFLEAANIAHGARSMFSRAFTDLEEYFSIKVSYGPIHQRQEWSAIISKVINGMLRKSLEYSTCQEQKFAQVILHGYATPVWPSRHSVLPEFIGIGKMMFPSKTNRDMTNLGCFAVHREWTPSQLAKMSSGPNRKGWNMRLVQKILDVKKQFPLEVANIDDWRFPETLAEDVIANAGMYAADAEPKVKCWDFFFLNDKNPTKPVWNRRIVMDNEAAGTQPATAQEWLYDAGDESFGESWQRIFSLQYADGNNVAPFWLHANRSLGKMLYGAAHLANRLRCKFLDATMREAMMMFWNVGDGDRERVELIEMNDLAVIPEGLKIVTADQRHQTNDRMFVTAQQQLRQLMAENSAHYTNDLDDGSKKEKTATQIIAESQASNALVGAMVGMALRLEEFQDAEICRRICDWGNKHPLAVATRDLMLLQGVPKQVINVAMWEIKRTRQIGNGNKTVQMAIADKLMQMYPLVGPQQQKSLIRINVQAVADDQGITNEIAPLEPENENTPTKQQATLAWGALIDGKPVVMGETTNRVEYAEVLIQDLGLEIKEIEQTQQPPDLRRLLGIQNVIQHISGIMMSLSQDPAQKDRIKQWNAAIAEVMGKVQEYAKMLEEKSQQQGQQQMDPATQAKVQATLITAQTKAKVKEADSAQKRAHSEEKFQRDMEQQAARTKAEIVAQDARTAAEITRTNAKAALEPKKGTT